MRQIELLYSCGSNSFRGSFTILSSGSNKSTLIQYTLYTKEHWTVLTTWLSKECVQFLIYNRLHNIATFSNIDIGHIQQEACEVNIWKFLWILIYFIAICLKISQKWKRYNKYGVKIIKLHFFRGPVRGKTSRYCVAYCGVTVVKNGNICKKDIVQAFMWSVVNDMPPFYQ
jgi:hypothetical protein